MQQKEKAQDRERCDRRVGYKGMGDKQCGKLVHNDEAGGIKCDICMGWFHPQCQDLTEGAYKLLKENDLAWFALTVGDSCQTSEHS